MQADTATPFRPFDPNAVPATADLPAVEKPAKKPSRKRKRRPARAATPKIPPAPKHKRPTRKKTAKKRAVRVARAAPAVATPRKTRQPRVQKVDLDTALSIGAMLKPSDLKVFGDIRQHLGELNKATRRRVLGAIQKVFG